MTCEEWGVSFATPVLDQTRAEIAAWVGHVKACRRCRGVFVRVRNKVLETAKPASMNAAAAIGAVIMSGIRNDPELSHGGPTDDPERVRGRV